MRCIFYCLCLYLFGWFSDAKCFSVTFDPVQINITTKTLYCQIGSTCRVYVARARPFIDMRKCNLDADFLTLNNQYVNEVTLSHSSTRVFHFSIGATTSWVSMEQDQLVLSGDIITPESIPLEVNPDGTVVLNVHGDSNQIHIENHNNTITIRIPQEWASYPVSSQMLNGPYEFIDFKRTAHDVQFDAFHYLYNYGDDPSSCATGYHTLKIPIVRSVPELGHSILSSLINDDTTIMIPGAWIASCLALDNVVTELTNHTASITCADLTNLSSRDFNSTTHTTHNVTVNCNIV